MGLQHTAARCGRGRAAHARGSDTPGGTSAARAECMQGKITTRFLGGTDMRGLLDKVLSPAVVTPAVALMFNVSKVLGPLGTGGAFSCTSGCGGGPPL